MNSLGVSLEARETRRLKTMLQEYLRDAEPDEPAALAEGFLAHRAELPGEPWVAVYLARGGVERELARAIGLLRRGEAAKVQARSFRAAAKERQRERVPATPAQQKALARMVESRPWLVLPEPLSKSAASQLIQGVREGTITRPA